MSNFLDKIKDIFFGIDNWQERLLANIQFMSPKGDMYVALWRGSPRTLDKKLAIFAFPKLPGNIVQDLAVDSSKYSIDFYFEGKDNDLQAKAFFQSAKQTGVWTVTHPIHGFLELQLVSLTENDQPVTDGNITEINSEWIEPLDPETLKTAREMAGLIDKYNADLNLNAAEKFAKFVNATAATARQAIETTANGVQNLTDFALGPAVATVDALDDTFNAIQNGIQSVLSDTIFKPLSLAGQIQSLIELPLLASNDVRTRFNVYKNLAASYLTLFPGGTNSKVPVSADPIEARNALEVSELALTATIGSLGMIAVSGELQTRKAALDLIDDLQLTFNDITNALDEAQKSTQYYTIDKQYFSQSRTYSIAALLISAAIRYLLISLFDLKIEKRFTLDQYKTPLEIAISEYGDLGDDDQLFDLFIGSNELHGDEIILLPPGKEIIVYV